MFESTNQINRDNNSVGLSIGVLTTSLFLVECQMMLGVGAIDSLGIVVFFWIYTITGAVIWQFLTRKCAESLFGLIGFGFPIGVSISAFFILMIRTIGLVSIPTVLLALFTPAISIFSLILRSISIRPTSSKTPLHELITVCLTPLIYLASWSKYALISLVITALLVLISQASIFSFYALNSRMREWATFSIVLVTVICALVIDFFLNPFDSSFVNLAQTAGADVIQDAAQSFGYGKFGFNDFVGQAGSGRNGYPLAFVVSEIFAVTIDMPRLLVAATSIQIITILALSSIFISIARLFVNSKLPVILLMVLLFAQASYPSPFLTGEYAKINNLLGLTLLMVSVFAVLNSFKVFNFRYHVTTFGLFVLTILTKPHHALILLVLVWSLTLLTFLTKNKSAGLKYLVALSLSMALTYFLAALTILQVDGARVPIGFSISKYWLLTGFSLFIARGLIGYLDQKSTVEFGLISSFRYASLICFSFSLFMTILLDGSNNMNYTISASLLLVVLANSGVVHESFAVLISLRTIRVYLILAVTFISAFFLYISYAAVNLYIVRSNPATLLRFVFGNDVPMVSFGILIALSILAVYVLRYSKLKLRSFHDLRLLVLAVSIVLNAGLFAGNLFVLPIKLSFYSLNESRNDFIRSDIVSAAIWLEQNSDVDSIVATNTICPIFVSIGEPTPGTIGSRLNSSECFERNTNMFVAAIASRRMFLEAPIFGPSGIKLDPETTRRYNLIQELNSKPTALTIRSLKQSGVSWILIDQSLAGIFDWSDFAKIRFTDGNTIVLSV